MNERILSWFATPGCIRIVAAMVALVCTSGGVTGEESGRRTVSANNVPISEDFPAVEVAPRGQQQIRELTYSPWRKLCFKSVRRADSKPVCRTTISGAWTRAKLPSDSI